MMPRRIEHLLKRWFVTPSSGLHLDVADGLRGLAILVVVCSHGFYFNPDGPRLFAVVGSFIGTGWVGVPIFFVLSGFLLSLPFFRKRSQNSGTWYVRGYITRRCLKIFPPFYLAILVLAIFYYYRYRDPGYFRIGAAWASGLAHFIYYPRYFNTSFWSLWVEVGFYVVLPLLFLVSRRASLRTSAWIMFTLLMVAPCVARFLSWPSGVSEGELAFFIRRFPGSLTNFAWGLLFAFIYVTKSREPERWRSLRAVGYLGSLLLLLSCSYFAFRAYHASPGAVSSRLDIELQQFLPGLSAFLMLFFVFDSECSGARVFCSPLFRFLGIVSYEWFLFHQPAQFQFREWFGSSGGSMIRFLFIVITPSLLTLSFAAFVYHRFSLPILQWGRAKVSSAPVTSPLPAKELSSCPQ